MHDESELIVEKTAVETSVAVCIVHIKCEKCIDLLMWRLHLKVSCARVPVIQHTHSNRHQAKK